MAGRVLMVVTGTDRLPDGTPTGVWFEEFAAPYVIFTHLGLEVVVGSPIAGRAPVDPRSREERSAADTRWASAEDALRTVQLLDKRHRPDEIDAVFVVGGHGAPFDLPHHRMLGQLLVDLDARGKVLAAVCHGPAAFIGPLRADGKPLVDGRTLTAFSNSEEHAVGLEAQVPFLLETTLRSLGATVLTKPDFTPHAVVDDNLITGQNPSSSERVAHLVIDALRRRASRSGSH
jgi:putative intracellular protease/amidase